MGAARAAGWSTEAEARADAAAEEAEEAAELVEEVRAHLACLRA